MSSIRPPPERTFKRSIDGFLTVFSNLKNQKTGEVEKPLKNALYNVGVLVILAALLGVFFVLLPFLSPLLWAFLVGAVLFPAKKRLSTAINAWIKKIEEKEIPIVVGILTFPISAMEKLGEIITLWLVIHSKIILVGLGTLVSLQIILYIVPAGLVSSLFGFTLYFHQLFARIVGLLPLSMVLILIIAYVISVYIMWKTESSGMFSIAGQSVWLFIAAYLCSFLGAIQIPAFIFVVVYGFIGLIYDDANKDSDNFLSRIRKNVFAIDDEQSESTNDDVLTPLAPQNEMENPATPIGRFMRTKNQLTAIKQRMKLNLHEEQKQHQKAQNAKEIELESDVYFKILFYACLATIIWNHWWIIFLCLIPISFYSLRVLFKVLGIGKIVEDKWKNRYSKIIYDWIEPRKKALMPVCLPGVLQLNRKLHKFFCSKMKSFVDDISAVVMILFLIVAVVFVSIFFFFQIYSETITVAQLGSNLINRTLTHRPDLVEMLPINMQSMNDIIDNAYKYSRTAIEDYLDNIFNGTDHQSTKLKTQILSVWDRLIQSYMDRNKEGVGPRVPGDSVFSTLDEIVTTSGVTFTGLFAWAKSNLGMLMEVGDSLWIVLKANISLLISTVTSLFSVLIGSGHAMLKFVFNSIIFFTTLYYLLQSSQDRYAPMALNINSAWGSRVADALEDSISSVLVATIKLSIFHGLFTWVTHTIFGAHVVYLPAILASILAAAPFLEAYWCSFPAVLDLWLSQDKFYLGLILFLIHFIVPSNFNPIVHSEIKGGGHPYLTALSIVGGMYLFGIEGAILGPLLLCLLVVLCSIAVNNLNSSPNSFLTRQSSMDGTSITTPTADWEFRKFEGPTSMDTTI